MDDQIRLRVLGPVEVLGGNGWIRPRRSQLRLLVALLALSAGRVVPAGELVEAFWEESPPRSARASIQNAVSRLRAALAGVPGCTLDRCGDGYLLRLAPERVDVHSFRVLARSARDTPDDDAAAAVLGDALALWRGPALADVPATAHVEAIRAGLAEERLSAAHDRFGRLLAAGRSGQAAAEISLEMTRQPLSEGLAGMLMTAWYRCGRQADALQVYRDLRARLAGELGVEPGPELQRLHQAVLSGDGALAGPGGPAGQALNAAARAADGPDSAAGIRGTGEPQEHVRPGAGQASGDVLPLGGTGALSSPDGLWPHADTRPVSGTQDRAGPSPAAPGLPAADGNRRPVTSPGVAAAASGRRPHLKRRRRTIITTAVVVVAIAAASGGYYAVTKPHKITPAPSAAPYPVKLATVTRQSLSGQTTAAGTLGYSGNYTVVVPPDLSNRRTSSGSGFSSGTFTWLPGAGTVVRQGQRLYSVSNSPVVLLYGALPVYRSLWEGMSGPDVRQLNRDLMALGYASKAELDPSSDYFSSATATALTKLQKKLALKQTGTLPVGQAVFEPAAVRVSHLTATRGAPVNGGSPVLAATSDTRQAIAQVPPTNLPDVSLGAHATITLPDQHTTPGVVTSIGTTASGSGGSGSSGSVSAASTVNVEVRLDHPAAADTLAQAPITVNITTRTVSNVLAVPTSALVAEPSGYAVEVAGPYRTRHIVPVLLGLFDDSAGLVQVTGNGLAAGQQVVIPTL